MTRRGARADAAFLAGCLALGVAACGSASDEGAGPTTRDPADADASSEALPPAEGPPPSIRFIDVTEASGLGSFVQENGHRDKLYIPESIGAGLALFDLEEDGDLDVYFANGSAFEGFSAGEEPRDALFLGAGDGTFTPAGPERFEGTTSWSGGVRAADIEGDGDSDLLITGFGRDALLVNDGGRLADRAAEVGLADSTWTTGASFFDLDRDGDLDLYVARYVAFDKEAIDALGTRKYLGVEVYNGPGGLPGLSDRLYRNDDGTFVDVSAAAGVDGPEYHAFQVVAFDQDADGWVDLYVANDAESNLLWHNQGDGTLVDIGDRVGLARSREGVEQSGMGVALGDASGDGRAELYVTNFSEDYFTYYEADAAGFFRDRTRQVGLAKPTIASLGWAAGFHDFDLDGDLDLFVVNGHVYPQMDGLPLGTRYRQKSQVFENAGTRKFREVPTWGALRVEESSRGAAFGDLDGDGDVDVVVSNLDARPTVLRNDSDRAGSVARVRVVGDGGNRDAVGAVLALVIGESTQSRWIGAGAGFLSSDEPTHTFGVPDAATTGVLRVTWPDGDVEEHTVELPGEFAVSPGRISAGR